MVAGSLADVKDDLGEIWILFLHERNALGWQRSPVGEDRKVVATGRARDHRKLQMVVLQSRTAGASGTARRNDFLSRPTG